MLQLLILSDGAQVRETKMNQKSSRSHLVVRLYVESRPAVASGGWPWRCQLRCFRVTMAGGGVRIAGCCLALTTSLVTAWH